MGSEPVKTTESLVLNLGMKYKGDIDVAFHCTSDTTGGLSAVFLPVEDLEEHMWIFPPEENEKPKLYDIVIREAKIPLSQACEIARSRTKQSYASS